MEFVHQDKEILKEGLETLPFWERQILIYRFWENLTIEEIAELMEMTWSEVSESLEDSFSILRTFCLSDPRFCLGSKNDDVA